MAEDERTIEPTDAAEAEPAPADDRVATDVESDGAHPVAGDGVADDELADDDVAESFLELEADLDRTVAGSQPHADGDRLRALVTDAERTDASAVPDGYPLDPATDEVLVLTLDIGESETTAFLEWPDGSGETPLRWLLDAMNVELGDLYGRQLLVERTGDHYAVVTPTEAPRGSGDWSVGVLAGLGLAAASLALLVATGGGLFPVVLLWLGLTLGWLPYATYRDAWYLRTHSDWDGGPLFWATLSALPVGNLFAGAAYLWTRSRAAFFDDEPSLRTRAARKIRSWL